SQARRKFRSDSAASAGVLTHWVIPGSSHTPAWGISSPGIEQRSPHGALQSWRDAMEHYVGLDVSLKLTAICIVDRTGKIERERGGCIRPRDRSAKQGRGAGRKIRMVNGAWALALVDRSTFLGHESYGPSLGSTCIITEKSL